MQYTNVCVGQSKQSILVVINMTITAYMSLCCCGNVVFVYTLVAVFFVSFAVFHSQVHLTLSVFTVILCSHYCSNWTELLVRTRACFWDHSHYHTWTEWNWTRHLSSVWQYVNDLSRIIHNSSLFQFSIVVAMWMGSEWSDKVSTTLIANCAMCCVCMPLQVVDNCLLYSLWLICGRISLTASIVVVTVWPDLLTKPTWTDIV